MSITIRVIVGAIGLASLVATALFVLRLVTMELDVEVLLAAYMAIGGVLVGAFFLFYAITGQWRASRTGRKH